MPTADLAIDLRDVAKTYRRRVHALRGIAMQVRRGEVFGLLGPNGAGKSTLVKIIMTVIRPTRAQGTVLGRPIGHKPTLAKVGYLPENNRFPAYLTGRQALEFYAAMSKVDRRTRRRRAGELLETVGMGQWANARLGTYSKGMQQRIGLAQALMSDPEVVVLDEPTDGLDPVGRWETRELLVQLRDQGKTVFLNSHLLSEVERICDRVAILVQGSVIRQGTIDELTAGSECYEVHVEHDPSRGDPAEVIRAAVPCAWEVSTPAIIQGEVAAAAAPLPVARGSLPSGAAIEVEGPVLRIRTGQAAVIQPVIDSLRARQLVIQSVRLIRQSLEDYFIQVVSNSNSHAQPRGALPTAPPSAKGGAA